jgi:hypothetical protein
MRASVARMAVARLANLVEKRYIEKRQTTEPWQPENAPGTGGPEL